MTEKLYCEHVQAFQLTSERYDDRSEWPSWLDEAAQRNFWKHGALRRTDNGEWEITLETDQLVTIGEDDWIVRTHDGELYPLEDALFQDRFSESTVEAE